MTDIMDEATRSHFMLRICGTRTKPGIAKLMKPWVIEDLDTPRVGDLLTGVPMQSAPMEV